MIAVCFALPLESRAFVRHLRGVWRGAGGPLPVWRGQVPPCEVLVVHTGIGLEHAGVAMHRLLAGPHPDLVISTGFAGALDPRLRVGDIVVAENYTDPEVLARYLDLLKPCWFGDFVTKAHVVERLEERRDLLRTTGAVAVEMETGVICAMCRAEHIPILALRVISDSAMQPLPLPWALCFDPLRQTFRRTRIARYLVRHPGRIARCIRFGRGILLARKKLGDQLARLLGEPPPRRGQAGG